MQIKYIYCNLIVLKVIYVAVVCYGQDSQCLDGILVVLESNYSQHCTYHTFILDKKTKLEKALSHIYVFVNPIISLKAIFFENWICTPTFSQLAVWTQGPAYFSETQYRINFVWLQIKYFQPSRNPPKLLSRPDSGSRSIVWGLLVYSLPYMLSYYHDRQRILYSTTIWCILFPFVTMVKWSQFNFHNCTPDFFCYSWLVTTLQSFKTIKLLDTFYKYSEIQKKTDSSNLLIGKLLAFRGYLGV